MLTLITSVFFFTFSIARYSILQRINYPITTCFINHSSDCPSININNLWNVTVVMELYLFQLFTKDHFTASKKKENLINQQPLSSVSFCLIVSETSPSSECALQTALVPLLSHYSSLECVPTKANLSDQMLNQRFIGL